MVSICFSIGVSTALDSRNSASIQVKFVVMKLLRKKQPKSHAKIEEGVHASTPISVVVEFQKTLAAR